MYSGSGAYTGCGIMGWVDLNSFFNATISIGYRYLSYVFGSSQNSVNKLVEYDDGGVPHIIALAEQHLYVNDIIQSRYYFLSCLDIAGILPTLLYGSFSVNERYDEVLLTENYIVFMGYDASPTINSLCYRKADPWNFPDSMFYDRHLFVNGNDPLSPSLSTTVYKDFITTSYLSLNGNNDMVTRIRTFDIHADANVNSQEYILAENEHPEGFVYIPADYSLVLMQNFYVPGGSYNTNFVFMDPFPFFSYNTVIEYKKEEFFHSLTMHDNAYYLAGDGASWFLRDKQQAPNNIPYEGCPDVDYMAVDLIGNLASYHNVCYLWNINEFAYQTIPSPPVVNSGVNVKCYNQ